MLTMNVESVCSVVIRSAAFVSSKNTEYRKYFYRHFCLYIKRGVKSVNCLLLRQKYAHLLILFERTLLPTIRSDISVEFL